MPRSFAGSHAPPPTPPALEGERERARSFPGGGRILYWPGSATGSFGRGIGIVEADGRQLTFSTPRGTFAYWNPGPSADILTIDGKSRLPEATSYRIEESGLEEADSWRLESGLFAVFSSDGRWIAEPAFNSRGRMKEDVIRLVDRSTGEASSYRVGLTPLAWAPDGRLITIPWGGGDSMLWNPLTGRTTAFVQRSRPELGEVIWSPDGSRFAADVWYGEHDSRSGIAIGTMRGELVAVSRHGRRFVRTPTWSPDSRRIAFIVRGLGRDGHRDSELITYDLATERTTVVARGVSDASWASWSPDGRWLLLDDWTRNRWLFVAADGSERIGYPRLGHFPRWCCPSSPPIDVPIPVC